MKIETETANIFQSSIIFNESGVFFRTSYFVLHLDADSTIWRNSVTSKGNEMNLFITPFEEDYYKESFPTKFFTLGNSGFLKLVSKNYIL